MNLNLDNIEQNIIQFYHELSESTLSTVTREHISAVVSSTEKYDIIKGEQPSLEKFLLLLKMLEMIYTNREKLLIEKAIALRAIKKNKLCEVTGVTIDFENQIVMLTNTNNCVTMSLQYLFSQC
jgi:RNA polymerase-binding transcription factor DksA